VTTEGHSYLTSRIFIDHQTQLSSQAAQSQTKKIFNQNLEDMETPKQNVMMETNSNEVNTPTSPTSDKDKQGVIVTPGSSKKATDNQKNKFIREPHDNDVLCGRGGSINSHPGNERFRQLVEKRKRVYLTARFKREKRLIANSILSEIRSLKPPGRFLAKDTKAGNWRDIGNEKARDKTSQALRENAPSIRAEIEVEINQQRAEMQRAEEEEAAFASAYASGHPHPYYQQQWGYHAPYPRYGQYHPEPPPYRYNDSYEGQWHNRYPEIEQKFNRSHSSLPSHPPGREPLHHPYSERQRMHSMPERRRETYAPSSIAPWTRIGFSNSHSRMSEHDEMSRSRTPPPEDSIPYDVNQSQSLDQIDPRDRRRMVHFDQDRSTYDHQHHSPYDYGHRRSHSGGDRSHSEGDYYTSSSHLYGFRHNHDKDESNRKGISTKAVTPESATRKAAHRSDDEVTSPHAARRRDEEVRLSHHSMRMDDEARLSLPPLRRDDEAIQPHESRLSKSLHGTDDKARLSYRRDDEASLHPASPAYDNGRQRSSIFSQVATNIMGSWDTNMGCATSIENSILSSISPTDIRRKYIKQKVPRPSLADAIEDEEQGQEVGLVEMEDSDHVSQKATIDEYDDIRDEEHRMPPPNTTGMPPPSRRIEIDWPSKMVGCQSNWLPETFNPPSFFAQKNSAISPSNNALSPSASYEMDESAAGTEGGSVGGSSLCQVFAQDQIGDGNTLPVSSPSVAHQGLTQMPSWERSVRSKSPLSICSDSSVQEIATITSKGNSTGDMPSHLKASPIARAKNYGKKE